MNRILVIVLLFFLAGCINNNDISSKIIPLPRMKSVMWDFLLADGIVSYNINIDSSIAASNKRFVLYKSVLNKHKISKDQFERSLKYYQSRPDLVKTLLDSLLAQSVRSLHQKNKLDSLPNPKQ